MHVIETTLHLKQVTVTNETFFSKEVSVFVVISQLKSKGWFVERACTLCKNGNVTFCLIKPKTAYTRRCSRHRHVFCSCTYNFPSYIRKQLLSTMTLLEKFCQEHLLPEDHFELFPVSAMLKGKKAFVNTDTVSFLTYRPHRIMNH